MAQPKPRKGPAFVRWFGPLLDALRELGGSASAKEAVDAVARLQNVPQAQREEVLGSGMGLRPRTVYDIDGTFFGAFR